MAKKAKKVEEAPALEVVGVLPPKTKEEAAALLSVLGMVRDNKAQIEGLRAREIAASYARFMRVVEDYETQEADIVDKLRAWAEANREALTNAGKSKSARLETGVISWRKQPDSVVVADEDDVIAQIEALGPDLIREFIKTTKSIDKARMLVLRDKAQSIKGVSIKEGVEKFEAKPNPIVPKGS